MATCTTTLEAIEDGVDAVVLDAIDLIIEAVWLASGGGTSALPLDYQSRSATLRVAFPRPMRAGQRVRFAVRYRVVDPQRGVYFTEPDRAYPAKPRQLWTHNQSQDARYWIPCLDYPDLKQTTATTIIVPRGLFALSNGALVERKDEGPSTIFRYEQKEAHSTYLLSLVVGEFSEIAQPGASVPIYYFVPPGQEAAGERSFGGTPQMLRVFEAFTGMPYPFARYSQIAVSDFMFGGMENTTATTQTDTTLHDSRAHLDFSSDPLVSHELAHQWFGNLLTTRDWAHAWLNEGFATYCEALYCEATLGWDEYCFYVLGHVADYLCEHDDRYARAIVSNEFGDPIEVFDRHLYQKGSAVLHMLRGTLGEDRFRRSIARYVRENARRSVETVDLVRAIEAETGYNAREFFDQWVLRPSHPDVRIEYRYDATARAALLTVEQKQPVDATRPPYRFSIVAGLVDNEPPSPARDAGTGPLPGERRITLDVERGFETFALDCPREPALLRVDVGAYVLATVTYDLGTDMHATILRCEPDVVARIRAAHALAKDGSRAARDALVTALEKDSFWGVCVHIAQALGTCRAAWAKNALIAAAAHEHPKVRRAAARALGTFRSDGEATAALRKMLDDPSYFVVAEALSSLGASRAPQAFEILLTAMKQDSWRDTISCGAAAGLGELADERAIGVLAAATAEDRTLPLRCAALQALGRLRPLLDGPRPTIVDPIVLACEDPAFRVRAVALGAAALCADPLALPVLQKIAERDPRLRRAAREAIDKIERERTVPAQVKALRDELERARSDADATRTRLEALERASSSSSKT